MLNKALYQALFEEMPPAPVIKQTSPMRPGTSFNITDGWRMTQKSSRPRSKLIQITVREKDKARISADDVIMEYVRRLIVSIKKIPDENFKPCWRKMIESFVGHRGWKSKLSASLE